MVFSFLGHFPEALAFDGPWFPFHVLQCSAQAHLGVYCPQMDSSPAACTSPPTPALGASAGVTEVSCLPPASGSCPPLTGLVSRLPPLLLGWPGQACLPPLDFETFSRLSHFPTAHLVFFIWSFPPKSAPLGDTRSVGSPLPEFEYVVPMVTYLRFGMAH